MQAFLCALASGAVLVLSAQGRPPSTVVDDATKLVRDGARSLGEELADRSKVVMGRLKADESRAIQRWEFAVQSWKKERPLAAGALLAEGVLFDCLSRFHGILTVTLRSETRLPNFLDLAAQRPKRASKAFESALKIDPKLTEARLRISRIRSTSNLDARKELERLAGETGLSAYLAAMSRAEAANHLNDLQGAQLWYERAVTLMPNAPAARVGLTGLASGVPLPFEGLDRVDPYYSYPCVVLTEPIAEELARRIRK
jgi:hypothetical protein